jgi:GTP 3',8-cyclase
MHDAHGREVNYLRVSLTDLCNFRCRYCMSPEGIVKLGHAEILSLEEMFSVVHLMVARMGFNKVRITGGEPLVRRGAMGFMKKIGAIRGIHDLSLTTNGYLLAPVAADLFGAGYRRVNISLDTLRPDRFAAITGIDGLERVLGGIEAARAAGFAPIKINAVGMKETLDEIPDLLDFCMNRNLELRFIELMPVLGAARDQFVPNDQIKAIIADTHELRPAINRGPGDSAYHAAAELFTLGDSGAAVGFISSMTHPFCSRCNRIRIQADGRLRPCLASTQSFDLRGYLRPTLRADALEAYIRTSVAGSKLPQRGEYEIDTMSSFGG